LSEGQHNFRRKLTMKTQTQILGEDKNIKNEKKFTIIDKYIDGEGDWLSKYLFGQPKYMTLICARYFGNGDDLILIHETENPSKASADAVICRGKWNDGIWAE